MEFAGEVSPDGMQRLLNFSPWDEGAARDALARYATRRVENCQVGVFTAYVTPDRARALIDRELYLPQKWTGDRARCRKAGIGDGVGFATKPQLARKMIGRAVAAGKSHYARRTRDHGTLFSY